jgi:hypothetical protein
MRLIVKIYKTIDVKKMESLQLGVTFLNKNPKL